MASGKSRTAYGYTETNAGHVRHMTITGIFGVKGPVLAPVALIPHSRNGKGYPSPERVNGMMVFVLPGGSKITEDGKPVG
jgi:hypothetical protein